MLSSFIITGRETLEAALVVGVVMAYLNKTQNKQYKQTVYWGIGAGVFFSLVSAFLFTIFAGGFTGKGEEIFEGTIMLFAAFLLTTMILWMLKQRSISKEIESKVASHIQKAGFNKTYAYGLFFLVLLAVLREGVETVIFFSALSYESGVSLLGGVLGVITAITIGYLFFVGSKKINLKRLFTISSVLLILIAAGLVAHGIHELEEAAVIPIVVEHVWDINPAVVVEGQYPLLHEDGLIGSFMEGLFGYNGNPSLVEVLAYAAYLIGIFYLFYRMQTRKSTA